MKRLLLIAVLAFVFGAVFDFTTSNNCFASEPVSDARLAITAKSSSYVGLCPKKFGFKGTFRIQHPNQATFWFERSDGTSTKPDIFSSHMSPKIFMHTWVTAWTVNKSGNYWIKMHVKSGNTHIVSDTVNFSVTCK